MQSRFFLVIVVTFIYNTSVYAENLFEINHKNIFEGISTRVERLIDEGVLDGVSIGVVNHSGLIWKKGFGYANREKKIKATENTVYRVGSLTKLLTATAILQLDESNIIDIDQAVSAYIPGFKYKSRFSDSGIITPRHLLTHLSGLPSNIDKGQWTEERFTNVVNRMRNEYVSYPTDFILNYSNVGYSMLGTIIEENTDYLFEDYIQHHLFKPLEMNHSGFEPYGATGDMAAVGYNKHVAQENLPIRDLPALGLNTSINDMSKFLSALLNKGRYKTKRILDSSSVQTMCSAQNSQVKLDYDDLIGIPWFIEEKTSDSGPLIVEHNGTTINYSSQVLMAPDNDLAVIILSNTRRVNSLIKKLANSLLNQLLNIKNHRIDERIPSSLEVKNITESGRKRYVAKSGIIEIDNDAKKLCDCQTNRKTNLVPLPDGWFGLSSNGRVFTKKIAEKNVDGKEVIVLEQDGKKHTIGSLYNENENRFNWKKYFGKYDIINPDAGFPVTDVEVFDEGKITYICYRMPKLSKKLIALPITPVSEKEAITEGVGRSRGETVRMQEKNGRQYLVYSGYIARKRR